MARTRRTGRHNGGQDLRYRRVQIRIHGGGHGPHLRHRAARRARLHLAQAGQGEDLRHLAHRDAGRGGGARPSAADRGRRHRGPEARWADSAQHPQAGRQPTTSAACAWPWPTSRRWPWRRACRGRGEQRHHRLGLPGARPGAVRPGGRRDRGRVQEGPQANAAAANWLQDRRQGGARRADENDRARAGRRP